ncbi:M16 family metallopeptidase [Synechococcus sp. H60.4]|uniref:M16 family metallopeptidase n=1 Tax=unclassified Synechococcus TaxID=2626047 RepID=UPI0039C1C7B4
MSRLPRLLPAYTHRLNSGLRVILHPVPIADSATVDVWVQTGGRNEPPQWLGISHFLEHMVFKGSERLAPGELDRAIEGRGGITNAATGQDYTHYYMTVAAADLPETLPYLAEAVLRAGIPPEEVERERQVVLEEIRRAADDLGYITYQLLMETAYGEEHPYGRPVLGTPASLMGLTPELLRAYHRGWYRPEYMTVVVTGGIDPEQTLALVEKEFGGPARGPAWTRPPLPPQPRPQGILRRESTHARLEQARLKLAWPTVSLDAWEEVCGLELLAAVLGDGRTSRLVHLLREQRGWVRAIGCSSLVLKEGGLFCISAHLEVEDLPRVEATLLHEIEKLQQDGIGQAELDRARRMLTHELLFSAESPSQLASLYGYYETLVGVERLQEYLELLQAFTPAQIRELAQQYLSPEAYVVALLKPAASDAAAASELQLACR